MKHRYDVKPSRYDGVLGYKTGSYRKPIRASLPSLVDMTSLCPPIQDQGQLGSCTAHAMSGMLMFLELQDFRAKVTMAPEEFKGQGLQYPSRLFIYWNERVIEGTTNQDSGAAISDSVSAVVNYGFCNEAIWPYNPENLFNAPTGFDFSSALRHRCSSYRSLDVMDLQACLAQGNPWICGIPVYESFESDQVAATGIVPMPNPQTEQLLGGHALCFIGYDDLNEQFIFRNSWSSEWGNKGYGRLPYQYIQDLASDFWTVLR